MPTINILDPAIFNRIAAGEVVESPRSVVKELVENSIDAGANAITIEITGGGIESISVTDNGRGLAAEDMPRAFLPHATSKIRTLDDLNAIGTLGFRGEALPSIASVAEVVMVSRMGNGEWGMGNGEAGKLKSAYESRTPNPEPRKPNSSIFPSPNPHPPSPTLGYSVTYQNGILTAQGEAGAPAGTSVTVKNLFANIPARLKFLKKPAQEKAKITELVEKLILANPNIAFGYVADGQTVYRTDGFGKESAVYAIYGEMTDSLIPILSNAPGLKISGYVSEPAFSKHNRAYQHLVVNGRVVENEDVAYSVFLAYKDFLMTRRFPAYVIYIDIPHDLIDVNVHPNKLSVKFVDPTSIKKAVYHAVRKAIFPAGENRSGQWSVVSDQFRGQETGDRGQESEELGVRSEELRMDLGAGGRVMIEVREVGADCKSSEFVGVAVLGDPRHIENVGNVGSPRTATPTENNVPNPSAIPHSSLLTPHSFRPFAADTFAEPPPAVPALTRADVMRKLSDDTPHSDNRQPSAVNRPPSTPNSFSCNPQFTIHNPPQFAGKLFNTYLIVQSGSDAFFIDQHAAHERLLYDRYISEIDRGVPAVQTLLVPYTFTATPDEAEFLNDVLPELSKLGFEIETKNEKRKTKNVGCIELNAGGDGNAFTVSPGRKGCQGDGCQGDGGILTTYDAECVFIISAVPAVLSGMRFSDFIADLLENPHQAFKKSGFLKEKIAQAACKVAVKGGDDLSEPEIESLISQMQASNSVPLCPHGRPTVVRVSKTEIEKWFKRVR